MRGICNRIYGKIYNVYKKVQIELSYQHDRRNNPAISPENKILLNIGAGDWRCLGWLNLDYATDWYKSAQEKSDFVPYDIRSDQIPFGDDSVDAIYCSHVIEHIEDEYVRIMFDECHRVLKEGSVLRIACPDAEFLYSMSKIDSDYWQWRGNDWFKSELYMAPGIPRMVDFLVREIATPKLLGYKYSINQNDYIKEFDDMMMNDFFNFLTYDLSFRREFPGDHINYWTFDKMSEILLKVGFKNVVKSKYIGSCCCEMTIRCKFDLTFPAMSLYVEAIK